MSKLKHIAKSAPNDPDWRFYCPGCQCFHVFRTTGQAPLWTFDGNLDMPDVGGSVLTNSRGQYHNPAVPTCHLFIRNGKLEYLNDCTHELAGQIVEMQDIEEA